MKAEFTAIIEEAPEGGYWAFCPEIPGANGQGQTVEEARDSLRAAVGLIRGDQSAQRCRRSDSSARRDQETSRTKDPEQPRR